MNDLFSPFALWPVRVELAGAAGVTLWGDGGGETDRLLADGDRLLLFTAPDQLRGFLARGEPCNLRSLAGYHALRAVLAVPGASPLPLEPAMHYPLVEIGERLVHPHWDWDLADCADVVDGLNLLWDAAATLDDEPLRQLLRGGDGPLGALADALTFVDEADLAETLAGFSPIDVAGAYDQALQRLSARAAVYAAS